MPKARLVITALVVEGQSAAEVARRYWLHLRGRDTNGSRTMIDMSLQLPTRSPCPYCENFAGRHAWHGPPAVVFEDDLTCVFLAPASLGGMEGHALVITRRHVETIFDLTTQEAAALGPMVVRTAHAVRSVLNPDGILVEQRNGVAADQTVPHLHVHVIPRKNGVQYPPEQWVEVTPGDQRAQLAQKLRARWA